MLLHYTQNFMLLLTIVFMAYNEGSTTSTTNPTPNITTTPNIATTTYAPTTTFIDKRPFSFTVSTDSNVYNTLARLGSNVSLDCTVTSSNKPIFITWLKDDVDVQTRNFRFFYDNLNETFSLSFNNVMLSDVGTYKCIVSDGKLFNISKIFVFAMEVNGKLELVSLQHRDILLTSSSIILECRVKGDEDIPRFYQWDYYKPIKEGQELTNQNSVWTSSEGMKYVVKTLKKDQCSDSLVLRNLKSADSGIYACTVFNSRGFVKATTNIVVSGTTNDNKRGDDDNNTTIITAAVCAGVGVLILIAIPFIWRKLKSKHHKERNHTYRYKSSLSQEPHDPM